MTAKNRPREILSFPRFVGHRAACNNGPLSVLDAYAKRLWEDYLSKFVLKGEAVQFRFDYHPLLR
jgi:hypothetical protein